MIKQFDNREVFMTAPRYFIKSFLSCLLALAITTVFSLSAYAAPEPLAPNLGAMTIAGEVFVNGNRTDIGMTLLSGSTVTTGADGIAIVELGKLGRATIGPRTTATLVYSPERLLITTTCDDMQVSLREGLCNIRNLKSGETKALSAVQQEHFDSNVEISAGPVVDVVVNCGTDVVCPSPVILAEAPQIWSLGFLLLGGIGTIGTIIIKSNSPDPRVSDTRP
jgi:hypothetical protein